MTRDLAARVEVTLFELVHMFTGDCLIGGGCRICDQYGDGPAALRILRIAFATELWKVRKAELVAQWMADVEQRKEPGRAFPWFIECIADRKRLPLFDRTWSEPLRRRYATIEANLIVLQEWREGHI